MIDFGNMDCLHLEVVDLLDQSMVPAALRCVPGEVIDLLDQQIIPPASRYVLQAQLMALVGPSLAVLEWIRIVVSIVEAPLRAG